MHKQAGVIATVRFPLDSTFLVGLVDTGDLPEWDEGNPDAYADAIYRALDASLRQRSQEYCVLRDEESVTRYGVGGDA